jgi:hypothetical protein
MFDHSCVGNALTRSVKRCLKTITGGVLTPTGFLSRQKALTFSNQVLLLLVGYYRIRQFVLCEKDFGWMALWELIPEVLGSLWLMASATWDGGITSAEGLHDWGRRAVPLFSYTLVFASTLRKNTENISQCSRVVGDYSLRRLDRLFRDSLGWPAEHQSTSVTRG